MRLKRAATPVEKEEIRTPAKRRGPQVFPRCAPGENTRAQSARMRSMKNSFTASLERIVQKNADEFLAFALGRMPAFVTGSSSLGGQPAVFCYHDIDPERFEAQLRRLAEEGYATLDCEGLDERAGSSVRGAKDVALTFDDGTWTFYTFVFPLLERYDARATLFVIAGLVPEDDSVYPNLEDVWEGRASAADLEARGRAQPLCTWRELEAMHASGRVDIQSHSMTHSRVPTSSRVIDFFFPGFPVETYGNVNIPLPAGDDPRAPLRALPRGAPIFESASRMAAIPRFVENAEPVNALARHVEEAGGDRFFERSGWRSELGRLWSGSAGRQPGRFESDAEMEKTILWELSESKRLLEERLPGKTVTHFCYPWFQGSATSDRLAGRAGYRAVHYGIALPRDDDGAHALPRRIQRISEEYQCRLPGRERTSLLEIALERIGGSLRRFRGPK